MEAVKVFNLFDAVKEIIGQPEYQASNGASHYLIGMMQEFSPRMDDSKYQAMFIGYNPTLYNENEDWIDILTDQSQEIMKELANKFTEVHTEVRMLEDNNTVIISSKYPGYSLILTDSDTGFYLTYIEGSY